MEGEKNFFPIAPAKPTEIRAESATTNSITLTWSPTTYADVYAVTWNLGEGEMSSEINEERMFTIPDLMAGSSYTIRVTAHNGFRETNSDIITGLTGKDIQTCISVYICNC